MPKLSTYQAIFTLLARHKQAYHSCLHCTSSNIHNQHFSACTIASSRNTPYLHGFEVLLQFGLSSTLAVNVLALHRDLLSKLGEGDRGSAVLSQAKKGGGQLTTEYRLSLKQGEGGEVFFFFFFFNDRPGIIVNYL